ncbi:GHKL domain-containing protein [Clostridium sp. MCC353]|uniref:sensor histidine kinase n=1 Tax=Clostridium sp. MCC353 TaxID=2592646 RepID=UPI001C02EDBE|nr:sensor histidine kinase [Clostridium sp. MCC353]MBT9778604.1 GHKL domain-containing protein [Clostridium sp. MCC353]
MLIGKSKGLPGEFLLLFTILIWLLFFLIYLGNRNNKLNRWCFISGMCFSMGVFKEYLYFTLFPVLSSNYPWLMNETLSYTIYSVLTAVMYYYAMPSAVVFALYFRNLDKYRPRLFFWLRIGVFIPAVLFGLRYPYTQTRYFQLYDYVYYLTAAAYNWLYGIFFTYLIISTLRKERESVTYHQKRLVAFLTLIPIWYELLSAFLIHALRIKPLFKLWQGNLFIILLLLVYYLYHAFNEGIMGTKFVHQAYDWNKEGRLINKSAHFIRHVVKNETAKIEWCANSIQNAEPPVSQEIDDLVQIIVRSAQHLNDYMAKIKDYSDDIILEPEPVDVKKMIETCIQDVRLLKPGVTFQTNFISDKPLYCDYKHVSEVISNLLDNALDAMGEMGTVTVTYSAPRKHGYACISITDTGSGIPSSQLSNMFDPYYTTKTTNHHMGLGLYYCRNVMHKHGGTIQAESQEGYGTTITLNFPVKNGTLNKRRD